MIPPNPYGKHRGRLESDARTRQQKKSLKTPKEETDEKIAGSNVGSS
jgi:hypothetical protein